MKAPNRTLTSVILFKPIIKTESNSSIRNGSPYFDILDGCPFFLGTLRRRILHWTLFLYRLPFFTELVFIKTTNLRAGKTFRNENPANWHYHWEPVNCSNCVLLHPRSAKRYSLFYFTLASKQSSAVVGKARVALGTDYRYAVAYSRCM